jgi:hypothetical protein
MPFVLVTVACTMVAPTGLARQAERAAVAKMLWRFMELDTGGEVTKSIQIHL